MIFDEKFIIALAFFVCVGLIIKLSRKNFLKFLSNTRASICEKISDVENIFNDVKLKISKLNDEKIALEDKHNKAIEATESEKAFLIEDAKKKSNQLFNNAIENQKIINERIKNESKKHLEKISWDSAKQNLTQNLVDNIEKTKDTHEDIINNLLNRALNDK